MDATATRKAAMIDAMRQCLGVASQAAKLCGIDRTTHYVWMSNDPEYKAAIEDTGEIALDYAESQLHKQIGEGQAASTIFYLKTKGKKRGYVERQEIEPIGETVIRIIRDKDL